MLQAMYSGISGLRAFKTDLDVIGNNIANVNTTAYKAGRATFKELLTQTLSGASAPTATNGGTNATQLGLGVSIGSIDLNTSQGSLQATGRGTDLGIEGNGYFALTDGGSRVYTRDGSFTLDAQHNLVSSATGMKVLGWTADKATGAINTSEQITSDSALNVPIGVLSMARQTTSAEIGGNIDASAIEGDSWNVESYIYDSLGLEHKVTMSFTKTDTAAEWDYSVMAEDVSDTVPVTTGTITFDANGKSLLNTVDLSLTFAEPNGSVQPLEMTVDVSKINQMNGENTASTRYQDGLAPGILEAFTIGRDGVISGSFTNGANMALGQIAIAEVNNDAGFEKVGSNTYKPGPNSGIPQMGIPGTSSRGAISAGYLEASNVDLANEFTNMIVAQRGFQANSKIITVSDEVLQDLVAMKR